MEFQVTIIFIEDFINNCGYCFIIIDTYENENNYIC